MRSRISGATLTVAFLVAGLAMPTSALARGWAVTPPAPLPANTNLVVCADGGSGPVVADGPNFRTATLTAGQCIPWSVHEGQYNVGLQYSPDPSAPTLSYIKVFRPGGQGATLAPPTVATNVAPFPDDPSIGPTDANGIPTGDTSGSDPINVTVVVLHFGPGPGGGGGGGGGGAGAGGSGGGGAGASTAGHHACGALTAHPTCPAA